MHLSVGIIGSGNVAWHLVKKFVELANVKVEWVYGRNVKTLNELTSTFGVNSVLDLPDTPTDLIIVCVNDDHIQEVIDQLPDGISVVYTSGTVALSSINKKNKKVGVFYPLQTFTKGRLIELTQVPFLIEAEDPEFEIELIDLAKMISDNVQVINSEQRKLLHVAAVIVNNFSNHLFYLANDFLKDHNLSGDLLTPLIKETVAKALSFDPYEAQSGPARRADYSTIDAHLKLLDNEKAAVYSILSDSILKTYSK